ncbi:unnamed protein product [Bursaphelenchus xylophilus]|uniref:(pine wood nematode) hypothetical protein n=1 Tax=Bursaphelenchus xylophilus TaxID=6326 RepID=A0A1I7SE42_BURXY|nr:unnamed protein product [Bursaphelenchus xylophilus]CAG9104217.1 unnamed protein product [Bursaphelenchus xylophilus]
MDADIKAFLPLHKQPSEPTVGCLSTSFDRSSCGTFDSCEPSLVPYSYSSSEVGEDYGSFADNILGTLDSSSRFQKESESRINFSDDFFDNNLAGYDEHESLVENGSQKRGRGPRLDGKKTLLSFKEFDNTYFKLARHFRIKTITMSGGRSIHMRCRNAGCKRRLRFSYLENGVLMDEDIEFQHNHPLSDEPVEVLLPEIPLPIQRKVILLHKTHPEYSNREILSCLKADCHGQGKRYQVPKSYKFIGHLINLVEKEGEFWPNPETPAIEETLSQLVLGLNDQSSSSDESEMASTHGSLIDGCQAIVEETTDTKLDDDAAMLIAQFAETALKAMLRECCSEVAGKEDKDITYDTIADVVQTRKNFEPLAMSFPKKVLVEEVHSLRKKAKEANWTKVPGAKRPTLKKKGKVSKVIKLKSQSTPEVSKPKSRKSATKQADKTPNNKSDKPQKRIKKLKPISPRKSELTQHDLSHNDTQNIENASTVNSQDSNLDITSSNSENAEDSTQKSGRRKSRIDYKQMASGRVEFPPFIDNFVILQETLESYSRERVTEILREMERADHDNNIYLVERLINRRWRNNRAEYFVKWLNYGEEENTWEPRANINVALCDQYDAEHGGPLQPPAKSPRKRKSDTSQPSPPKKTARGAPKNRESITPSSSRRSSRRRTLNTDDSSTSIEPTPTPEPTAEQKKEDEKPEEQPLLEPEPQTSAEKSVEPAAEEPAESEDSQQGEFAEEQPEPLPEQAEEHFDQPTEQPILDPPAPPANAEPVDDIPDSFIEPPEEPNQPVEEAPLPKVTSYLVSNEANPNDQHIVQIYENAPQSLEAADNGQIVSGNGNGEAHKPQEYNGNGDELRNAVRTDVTVNNQTSTIWEL